MDVKKYKKRLLDLQKSLDERAQRDMDRARGELRDTPGDAGDLSVADVAVDSEFTEAELNSVILQQVQDALRRIENGTYGKCLADGKPMPEKRLDAVPWAAYCARHQAMLEAASEERHWTL